MLTVSTILSFLSLSLTLTSAKSIPSFKLADCIPSGNDCISYSHHGSLTSFNKIILMLPDKRSTPHDFIASLLPSLPCTNTKDDVLILSPVFDLAKKAPYEYIDRKLIGNLELGVIIDTLLSNFIQVASDQGNTLRGIVVAGFSKGGQGVQRYSLIQNVASLTTLTFPAIDYVYGCASSWTFLDETVDYRYGINNLPSPYTPSSVISTITGTSTNNILIACGSKDKGSNDEDPGAAAQGSGRLERAQNLVNSYTGSGVTRVSMNVVKGATHNAVEVLGHGDQATFICS